MPGQAHARNSPSFKSRKFSYAIFNLQSLLLLQVVRAEFTSSQTGFMTLLFGTTHRQIDHSNKGGLELLSPLNRPHLNSRLCRDVQWSISMRHAKMSTILHYFLRTQRLPVESMPIEAVCQLLTTLSSLAFRW